ncbi:unnamed protein product, partial [Polarella glacialis]
DLYRDRNGWYPRQLGQRRTCTPQFEVKSLTLHDSPCLTMDLRITEEEIIAVSEAPRERGHRHGRRQASVSIIDPGTRELRGRFEVSDATINCCDVGPGLICLGSDDSKVRLYRRSDLTGCSNSCSSTCRCCSGGGAGGCDGLCSSEEASSTSGGYSLCCEYLCSSTVNDLRFAREDAIIAVRTHQNRHPV